MVDTPAGKLRGESQAGVRVFRGVPFAQPPIGPGRFLPPAPVQPWTGVREARQFAAAAVQPHTSYKQSEDCLYLNVWAPESGGPYPVLFYIHGGGFTGGRSSEPIFEGAQFAREGIVCITVAYRLGALGFLDVGPLLGSHYAGSASNGLRDLICALAWVQANVGAFGGDARRVTVAGESAGAKLTGLLMGTPSAQRLFSQMISESGGAERLWSRENAEAVGQGFGRVFSKSSGAAAASLLAATPEAIIAAQEQFLREWPQHFPLRAEVDGTLLNRLPIDSIAAGSSRGKRLLIGTNLDESSAFVGPHPSHDAIAADLGNMPLENFLPIHARYKDLYPDLNVEQRRIRALTAEEYWIPSMRLTEAHVAGGGQAWLYRLDFAETSGRLRGYAYHSLDNALVWDHPHAEVENAAAEAALARQMHAAWAAFIRDGRPSAAGLPEWPAFATGVGSTMILNTTSRVEQRPQAAEERLWPAR